MARREITGRHVLIGFTAAFAVIIGVNVVLAVSAIRTFPGLEVKNGYVASQTFNERKAAQLALGWKVQADVRAGTLLLTFTDAQGHPVRPDRIEVSIGRATESDDDVIPDLDYVAGSYEAPVTLGKGKWVLRLKAYAEDGTLFQQRRSLVVDRG